MNRFTEPALLHPGSHIRIVSPSGVVQPEFVFGAKAKLESWGYRVSLGEHALFVDGRFAGNPIQRLNDLQLAFDDPDVDMVLCSRGGYGLSQIIDRLDLVRFLKKPKWVVGFSDITLLHNLLHKKGISSMHGIMAKHLQILEDKVPTVSLWRDALEGRLKEYVISSEPENITGVATGRLIGGNLSMLMAARGTYLDLDYKGSVLFIEEIAESAYHIDRMFHNLRLSGALGSLSALIVGHLTDCPEDPSMQGSLRDRIKNLCKDIAPMNHIPLVFGFPSGHEDVNLPLLLGKELELNVSADKVLLKYI